MHSSPLSDTFGRKHDYLRISLTDACNLRCVYCMPNEKVLVTPSAKLMQASEIESIAGIFIKLGVKKIRLTGGEPLLRKDAKNIMQRLSKFPVELAVSTNAVLVNDYVDTFKESNIRSVNVSLDTLNADEFFAITKRGDFKKIMMNIHLLLSEGFKVKVNMVVMKGINEHAILDFIHWTKDYALDVRFIEFMPFSGNAWNLEKVFSYRDMLDLIGAKYTYFKLEDAVNDTAKKYKAEGHAGTFSFITTITAPFCGSCNRLRLTADGKMKNCLFSQGEADLLTPFRNGENIESLIMSCIQTKKLERGGRSGFEGNNLEEANLSIEDSEVKEGDRSMIRIGG
ncbi:MAG: GTP 3',8-cyclase MoaA [Bacteroidota bacterium]